MSYCLNPDCPNPHNTDESVYCSSCGFKLVLGERYRAIQAIGQGGFGRTFLAVDEYKPSKPYCVIKQFFPEDKGTKSTQKASELFHQEAARLDELGKHPQIPELLAYFTQDHYQYLVQEFIDGQNLAQELAESGAFTEDKIRQLLNDLLAVLQFVHSRQVIHRDIKPENIIRRRTNNQLFLVDFGASKLVTSSAITRKGTVIGSPGYASPEQYIGEAVFASDLYSLGVTCIHLLTTVDPFNLFDSRENCWGWRNYLAHPISCQLSYVLDKLLEPVISKRYQSAAAVQRDCHRIATPITALPPAVPVVSPYLEENPLSQIQWKEENNTPIVERAAPRIDWRDY